MPARLLVFCVIIPALAAGSMRVPPGFVVEKVASEPEVRFPMFATQDERGRLFVVESSGGDLYREITDQTRKCRVRLLEDGDGMGSFEKSTIFAEKLNFPMGLVWRAGKLYLADPPDLVTLEDTNDDGRSDKRQVLVTGFGHRDNGSLHGLTFGPDGMLYMTCGEPDGYKIRRADGTILEGHNGALLRCRPDGPEIEVLARGFVNLVEVVFTPSGEIIGTDNWFVWPTGGIRDALVHLVPGGLYPLHLKDVGTQHPVLGEPLSAITLMPAVAVSGLVRYRGSSFPGMQGNLFSAQHNSRTIGRHVLVRENSTFRSEDEDFLSTDDPDFHPSDVLEDADGSLLVIDTGSWYTQHCPTGRIRRSPATGGIYRIRYKKGHVADPRGKGIEWSKQTPSQLAALLGDPRPVVQDKAMDSLISFGVKAVEPLGRFLSQHFGSAGCPAVWALAAIPDESAAETLRASLSADTEVAAAAARALGVRKDKKAAKDLAKWLNLQPEVTTAVAEALAHCGGAADLDAIWRAMELRTDPFLEHALAYAAHHLGDDESLTRALNHKHPAVRRTALLLLDQPPRSGGALPRTALRSSLASDDGPLRRTALKVLQNHPEWGEIAREVLGERVTHGALTDDQRKAFADVFLAFQKEPQVQDTMAKAISSPRSDVQLAALEALAEADLPNVSGPILKATDKVLSAGELSVRSAAIAAVAALNTPALDQNLRTIAEDSDGRASVPASLRLDALRALAPRNPTPSPAAWKFILAQLQRADEPLLALAAGEILKRTALTGKQLIDVFKALPTNSIVSPAILLPALRGSMDSRTAEALLAEIERLQRSGNVLRATDLVILSDKVPAEFQSRVDSLKRNAEESFQANLAKLQKFELLLKGGNPDRGRAVFFAARTACATCHAVGNEGGKIGPDLTKLGAIRAPKDILESVLLPSSTFAQSYEPYFVVTKDGRELHGMLTRQTPESVVLRDGIGGEVTVPASQVRELRRQEISVMPEGLEGALTEEEFRDLLAFLQELK